MNDPIGTGARSLVDKVAGKAKAVVGEVLGSDSLRDEGHAQQDKASSERDAAVHQAKADKANAEVRLHEAREEAASEDR